ncbi:hypothetical protein H4R18_003342 [Coemansia javaensis]|uniref:tRNA (adenine(58)-N(1))-methyltransferase catalytic subunit TRM61 n=1 Tax=Coemansia javaensis TaxID=2761396 RepID=A0A9W8LIQ9_9FUNG|nr:hypothetical protein H4R18_003342 [Coemansia javaensis]
MVLVREGARGGKQALVGPLRAGGEYGTRRGTVRHSDIIGRAARARVDAVTAAGAGGRFMVHFPTLAEYVVLCGRQCTPIYPKDAAAIVAMLDAAPGARLLEAGTGNAGLTMHLARAVGPAGTVFTAERDRARAEHARQTVARFRRGALLPSIAFHVGALGDVVREIVGAADPQLAARLGGSADEQWRAGGNLVAPLFDGVVLDMPTPWTQLPLVFGFLKTDRYAVCYLPNMSQVVELVQRCRPWPLIVEDVVEVDWRSWDVRPAVVRSPEGALAAGEPMVCRPTHTPTGHTAFLVKLRKCAAHHHQA